MIVPTPDTPAAILGHAASLRRRLSAVALMLCAAACASEAAAPGTGDAGGADDGKAGSDGTVGGDVSTDDGASAADAQPAVDADVAAGGDDALAGDDSSEAAADAGTDASEDAAGADAPADAAEDAVSADVLADAAEDSGDTDAGSGDAGSTDAGPSDAGPAEVGPTCTPSTPSTEACDGIDNDCDGTIDQGPDGQPVGCSDDDACTTGDACAKGACASGAPKVCDDADACTVDGCDAPTGDCTHAAAPACSDGQVCTDDACDKAKGCVATPNAAACDDGDACTTLEACSGGACAGGSAKVCDDGNSCTIDACDKTKGCGTVACVAEGCGKGCDDGDPCTAGDACSDGVCKAGGKACDDGNPCTTDGCDAKTGDCAHTAIAGCLTCKVVADCDDSNACTTDACSGGVCKASPIAGCVGPTDYAILSMIPSAPKIQLPPGALKITFEIENLGKPYAGAFPGKLNWALWASGDDKVDAADTKIHSEAWDGYNIGAGAATKASKTTQLGLASSSADLQKKVLAAKYLCLLLTGGGDANVINNLQCIANPVVAQALAVSKLTVADNAVTAHNNLAHVSLDIANTGIDAATATLRAALSADDKLDAGDLAISATLTLGAGGSLAVGKTATYTLNAVIVPYTVKPGPAFLCVEVNPDGIAFEAKADDNAACVAVSVVNQADLHLNVANVRFRTKTGAWAENPTYGTEYGCGFVEVSNVLYGAAADVPVRCWLHPTSGAPWPTSGDAWKLQWTMKGPVPGKPNQVQNVLGLLKSPHSDEVAPMTGANTAGGPIGVTNFCAHLNYDGSANEIANSGGNSVCRKITVLGSDLIVGEAHAKVGHATWKDPQPATIPRGVALNLEMALCNKGNQVLSATQQLKTRILLSKDKVASADDHVIHSGTGQGGYSKFEVMGTYPSGCGQLFGTEKATLPTSHATGAHFLIFDVNHDGAYVEPPQNNAVVKPVTVL